MGVFSQVKSPSDGAVWITGASAGIGRALALKLASEGWRVYATARNTQKLEVLAADARGPGQIIAMPGDVTDHARMAQIVTRIVRDGPLALAILNAGIYVPMRAQAFDARAARDTIDVNLTGVTNALAPLLSEMIAARSGHIAIMASVAGYRGLPGAAPYSGSKAALIAMAEALAMDLVDLGVRLSVINPGFVETDATAVNDFQMPFLLSTDEAADRIIKGLKRPGFEIAFPRRFAMLLRLIGLLPNRAYIWAVRRMTGWHKM